MTRESTVFQLRLDDNLKQAFVAAAERENTTPSRAMRALIESFVQESWRKEAERQSRIVAEASEEEGIMDEIERAQAWIHD